MVQLSFFYKAYMLNIRLFIVLSCSNIKSVGFFNLSCVLDFVLVMGILTVWLQEKLDAFEEGLSSLFNKSECNPKRIQEGSVCVGLYELRYHRVKVRELRDGQVSAGSVEPRRRSRFLAMSFSSSLWWFNVHTHVWSPREKHNSFSQISSHIFTVLLLSTVKQNNMASEPSHIYISPRLSGGGVTDGIATFMCHSDVCARVCQNEIDIGFVCPWCQNKIKFGYVCPLW